MKYVFLFAVVATVLAFVITFILGPMVSLDVNGNAAVPNGHGNGNGNGIGNGNGNGFYIPEEHLSCETDSDCFAGECCHPRYCVNRAGVPDCEGDFCTQECRSGTMDCGCGSCACVDGMCTVKLVESEFCLGQEN
jgi:hypothetical protein